MKIVPSDITGAVGILPTPATPDADRWSTTSSVNLDEVSKMVPLAHKPGINFLMTTGTFGECSSLLESEVLEFVDCIIQSNKGRVPLFVGVTTLNTRATIAQARTLLDRLPIDGLFLGRPMWLPLDDKGIVQYYRDLAEAFPGIPQIVYDNPMAFKGKISPAAYVQLAEIPEVVAAKHTGGPKLLGDVAAVGNKMKILPIDSAWVQPVQENPAVTACWSGNTATSPDALSALAVAVEKKDWARAQYISDRLEWASEPMFPGGSLESFMPYSIQIGHARFKTAGLIDPGPARPPYTQAPEEMLAGGLEAGRRLRDVQVEFAVR